jgi:hypothetical protein
LRALQIVDMEAKEYEEKRKKQSIADEKEFIITT